MYKTLSHDIRINFEFKHMGLSTQHEAANVLKGFIYFLKMNEWKMSFIKF